MEDITFSELQDAGLPDIKINSTIRDFKVIQALYKTDSSIIYQVLSLITDEKIIMKAIKKDNFAVAMQEVENMRLFNHPNIMTLLPFGNNEYFIKTDHFILIFMIYCDRRDLLEYIIERGKLSEEEAKQIMVQIASALQFIHSTGFLHRDMKLENIFLMNDCGSEIPIPIIGDLGSLIYFERNKSDEAGTRDYMAPELLRHQNYEFPVDIWALGVILYALLTGKMPFPPSQKKYERMFLYHVCNGIYDQNLLNQLNISDEAKDLISHCLTVDPAERITINEILSHPWMVVDFKQTTNEQLAFLDQELPENTGL